MNDIITKYYKNLCENLQQKINYLQHLLNEAQSEEKNEDKPTLVGGANIATEPLTRKVALDVVDPPFYGDGRYFKAWDRGPVGRELRGNIENIESKQIPTEKDIVKHWTQKKVEMEKPGYDFSKAAEEYQLRFTKDPETQKRIVNRLEKLSQDDLIRAANRLKKLKTEKLNYDKKISATNSALNLGGGLVGGLVGEYLVKPAAEKLGVFDDVEKITHQTLSKMPDWAANATDKALGAAQAAIDPVSAMQPIMQKGIDRQSKREVDSALKAEKPSQVRISGPKV